MTQITEEQRALHAKALASASSGNPTLSAAAQQNPDFPAPEVPSAPGGVLLNPHLADPSGISVEVYYPTMDATDVIGLIFNGNNTFVPQKGSAAPDHKVTFQVPKEDVAKALGKTVEVSYVVGRDTGPAFSQTLNLVVNPIPDTELPTPQVVQAAGGFLDVQGLQANADVLVDAWPLIAAKQKMWMRLEGSSNLDLPDWQGYEIVSTGAQVATVPLSYLQGLTDGSQLKLVLQVSFDGGLTRQGFPVSELTIKNVPKPIELSEDFSSYPYIVLSSNTPHKFIGMTATSVSATVTTDYMNGVTRHALYTNGTMPLGVRLTLTFDYTCSNISFIDELNGYGDNYKNWLITVFDTEGIPIQSWLPGARTQRNITHPGIAKLEAKSMSNHDLPVSFNDFKMTFSPPKP